MQPMQVEIASLDYKQLLPLFLDGIRETEDPFRFLAVKVDNHHTSIVYHDQSLASAVARSAKIPRGPK